MKIYNAKLIGISENESKKVRFYYFAYKSRFVNGTGCIVCSEGYNYPIPDKMELDKYYDLYINNKNGYNNISRAFEHVNKG